MTVTSADPVVAGVALRAVIAVADEALDVAASEDRLLVRGVSGITAVLGDDCTIWLSPAGPGELPAVASSHPDAVQADVEHVVADLGAGPARLYAADEPSGAWLVAHGLRQCVIAPVLVRGQAIGTLVATRSGRRDPFADCEVHFAAAMADMIGIAVQTSRVRNDAMVTLDDLRQHVQVTDNISDALIACDYAHLIVGWNTGAEQIYGYNRDEAIGCHLFTLLATEFYADDGDAIGVDTVLDQLGRIGQWSGELRERRADGAPLTVLSSITQMVDGRQQPTGLVAVSRDVTAQRRGEYQALHDPLTGLPNRRMLNTRLYEATARACRRDEPLAVLFIDLDGFKPINDTHGHAAGDAVLTATARRLNDCVRARDTVGRFGGDEFLVIIEDAGGEQQVADTVRRICAALAQPIPVDGGTVTVLPSIGACVAGHPGRGPLPADRMLDLADRAMYAAKREKRGTVFVTA